MGVALGVWSICQYVFSFVRTATRLPRPSQNGRGVWVWPICLSFVITAIPPHVCHAPFAGQGDEIPAQVHRCRPHHPALLPRVEGSKVVSAGAGGRDDPVVLSRVEGEEVLPPGESGHRHPEPLPGLGCSEILRLPQGCGHHTELLQGVEGRWAWPVGVASGVHVISNFWMILAGSN